MNWLERFILLERLLKDTEKEKDKEDGELRELLYDTCLVAWDKLNEEDIKYLNGRGMIDGVEGLDKVKMPENMTWLPVKQLSK